MYVTGPCQAAPGRGSLGGYVTAVMTAPTGPCSEPLTPGRAFGNGGSLVRDLAECEPLVGARAARHGRLCRLIVIGFLGAPCI